jgi:hypothetical protein
MGTYVDDSLSTGTDDFEEATRKTLSNFDSRQREFDDVTFAGVHIKRNEDSVTLSQGQYISKLSELSADCSFADFRSARARLAWACNTRPDACFAVGMASQTVIDKFGPGSVTDLNNAIRSVRTEQLELRYLKLYLETLRFTVYTDSSYANCEDFSSQIGFVVMLTDISGKCAVLDYASKKSRRTVRSILGGEMLAFAEGFHRAFVLQHSML